MPHDNRWISNWTRPEIRHGVLTKWNWLVLYPENLKLGFATDIGAFTLIMAKYGVEIEDDVEIGSHCAIFSESSIDGRQGPVIIHKGCKIGSHTVIMPRVEIGTYAIVGAHSLVRSKTKILPNSIGFGIPYRCHSVPSTSPASKD